MKKVWIAMAAMFLLMVFPGAGIWTLLFSHLVGGGVSETYLYPIYGGIVLLAGLVVGCTVVLPGGTKIPQRGDSGHQKGWRKGGMTAPAFTGLRPALPPAKWDNSRPPAANPFPDTGLTFRAEWENLKMQLHHLGKSLYNELELSKKGGRG